MGEKHQHKQIFKQQQHTRRHHTQHRLRATYPVLTSILTTPHPMWNESEERAASASNIILHMRPTALANDGRRNGRFASSTQQHCRQPAFTASRTTCSMETWRGIILVSIECSGDGENVRVGVTGWRVVLSDENQVVRCWLHSSLFKRMLHST
jgi:hypothetical protein